MGIRTGFKWGKQWSCFKLPMRTCVNRGFLCCGISKVGLYLEYHACVQHGNAVTKHYMRLSCLRCVGKLRGTQRIAFECTYTLFIFFKYNNKFSYHIHLQSCESRLRVENTVPPHSLPYPSLPIRIVSRPNLYK